MRNLRDADIEIHKEYIDIQVLLSGKESFGWKATRDLKAEKKAYTRENDIAFYSDKADLIFTLSPGEFVIFFQKTVMLLASEKDTSKSWLPKSNYNQRRPLLAGTAAISLFPALLLTFSLIFPVLFKLFLCQDFFNCASFSSRLFFISARISSRLFLFFRTLSPRFLKESTNQVFSSFCC